MSRELKGNSGGDFPPVVKFNTANQKFVGILEGIRDSQYGKVFQFKVVTGDAFIGKPDGTKNEKGHNNHKDVDVKPGDLVEVGTSKMGQLEQKLLQAIVGEKIEIIFVTWKVNPKTGRSFKDWKVTILD